MKYSSYQTWSSIVSLLSRSEFDGEFGGKDHVADPEGWGGVSTCPHLNNRAPPLVICWYGVGFFLSDPYQVRPWSAFVSSRPPTTHTPTTTLSSEIESCTSDSPKPSNPYIFWKLMSIAIQKRQRDTNTKTMTITNTKTKTKTKTRTPRQYLEHLQCAIFSESWWLAQSSPALPRTV